MSIKTTHGKHNLIIASILNLNYVTQQYIANIISDACNSQILHAICSKGYLITFCKSTVNLI
jgi:hypothetical protein